MERCNTVGITPYGRLVKNVHALKAKESMRFLRLNFFKVFLKFLFSQKSSMLELVFSNQSIHVIQALARLDTLLLTAYQIKTVIVLHRPYRES